VLVEVLLWVVGTGLPGGRVFLSGGKCIRVSFWGSGFLFLKSLDTCLRRYDGAKKEKSLDTSLTGMTVNFYLLF